MNKLNTKKLDDPLEEKILPGIFKTLNYNHHSPTSAEMLDGPFVFQKIKLTQEQRRLLEGNANMAAGVAVNDALQDHYSNTIWRMNPLTKKLKPQLNEKLSQEAAIQKAVEKFKEYNPVNEKDREKFYHYQETIPQTIRQGFKACETIGIAKAKEITAEAAVNNTDYRLHLPIVGRTDLHFQDFNEVEQSTSASAPEAAPFLSVLELKTAWQKPGKTKKDGSRSFSSARLPSLPSKIHLQQLAFYCKAKASTTIVSPLLCYLTADGFKIFTKDNCTDLEPENLNNYYEQLVNSCLRKERLLARHIDLDEPDMILKEIVRDVDPEFSHPFFWSIGQKYLSKAKKIWSNT